MGKCLRIFAFVLTLVLLVSSLPVSAARFPETDRIIVSLGDSYSAGEGIEPFYGQNLSTSKKVANEDWLAHRSSQSWPGQLQLFGVSGSMNDNRNSHWFFQAVSGAKTTHITETKQKRSYDYHGYTGKAYMPVQIDVFQELKEQGLQADYVTMTIGGNDMDFAGVVELVLTSGLLTSRDALSDRIQELWKLYNGGIDKKIRNTYVQVMAAAGPQATLIVAGYPRLFNDEGKGPLISKEDAKLVNTAVSQFNDKLEGIVQELQKEGHKICFVSVEEDFAGHEAYCEDAYIQEISVIRKEEDLKGGPSDYSMHPNDAGAAVYARRVQETINRLEKEQNYHTLRRKLSKATMYAAHPDGNPVEYTFQYTDELLTSIEVRTEGEYEGTLTFTYDGEGRLLTADNGGLLHLYSNRYYTYNSAGQMTEVRTHWYGSKEPTERCCYEYDSYGNLSQMQVYDKDPDDNTLEHTYTYTYNNRYENGVLVESQRITKWCKDDYRVTTKDGDFWQSELIAVTRYTYWPDGKVKYQYYAELPPWAYDVDGNHRYPEENWHETGFNHALLPLLVISDEDYHNLVICDSNGTQIWSAYLGKAKIETNNEGYITRIEEQEYDTVWLLEYEA